MHGYKRYSTARQMGVSVAVFAALVVLLESGGMWEWAQRLELGPERTAAVAVTGVLQRGLRWDGLAAGRQAELRGLARVGWTDDAAAVASAQPVGLPVTHPAGAAALAAKKSDGTTSGGAATASAGSALRTPMLALQPMVGAPPGRSALPVIAAVGVGKVRTVALAGDSMMAVGLSSTLLREGPKYKDLVFVRAFKSGTGLARPEVFNWQAEYPAMLRGAKPDVVLVAIGANDGQGFVEDGVTYPFGSEGWKAIYERRVEAYLAMLESDGAEVVWVGLPPMKSGVYNAKIALVNAIDYAVVSASPHAIWFSTAGLVGDEGGNFRDYGEVGGSMTRLRQSDGIHMSDDGASLLTAQLLPWLAKQESAVVPVAAKAETASVDAGAAVVKP